MLTHFCIKIVHFKVISLQFAVIILGIIPREIPREILILPGNVDNKLMVLCGLSELIVKNGGGRMLEQLVLMSFALRVSLAPGVCFLTGY